MQIYNESGELVESPDLSLGRIEERAIPVWHTWTGDAWRTVDAEGHTVPYENIDPDLPHGERVPDWWQYGVYVLYSTEELAAMEHERAEAAARTAWYAAAPQVQAETDAALCELWEQLLAQQQTICDQDNALCAVYELVIGA